MIISSLAIGLDRAQSFLGVAARKKFEATTSEWLFEPLASPIPFTGGVLVGREFTRAPYVHMGHHPIWSYDEVVELTFVEGKLATAQRHGEAMATLRDELGKLVRPAKQATLKAIAKWVDATFALRYPGLGE